MIRFLIGMVLVLFMIGEVGAASPVIDAGEVRPKAANTNLYLRPSGSGSLRLGSFSGILKASTGVLSASAVDLTTEITGILPIANGGTGSAAKNFVDLTTTQSIAGLKTFSDQVSVNDPLLMDHTTSTAPAAGKCAFYPKADGNFYKFCNGGSEEEIGSGGVSTEALNAFSARIANGCASVTSEDADWIASVSSGGSGTCIITFTTGFFSVVPAITIGGNPTNRIVNYDTLTTSGVTIKITTDGGSATNDAFSITASRQGADWNIGSSVSQNYSFAGSSYLPATTNCTPTIATGGVLSAFGTDADCPVMTIEYSELGTWSTADQNKFSQVITDLPAGTYRACMEFITSINGSEVMGVAINDGTTSSPTTGYGGYASGNQFGARRCAIFRYTSAGTRTFQPYVISGGSTITHQNAGSFASYFTLERVKP